jgi:hypothetical protein
MVKFLFITLAHNFTHRIWVGRMFDSVHYHVAHSALTHFFLTPSLEVYIQGQTMHFVFKSCA